MVRPSKVITRQLLYHTNVLLCSFLPEKQTGHSKPQTHKPGSNCSQVSQEPGIFCLNQHAADEVGVLSHVSSEPLIHCVVLIHLSKANKS